MVETQKMRITSNFHQFAIVFGNLVGFSAAATLRCNLNRFAMSFKRFST